MIKIKKLAWIFLQTVIMDLSSDSDIDVAYEMHIRSFTFEFEGPRSGPTMRKAKKRRW